MHAPRWERTEFKYGSLALAALLAACGGGGDSGTTATPTTPVTPASITLSGTASTGAAVADKAVDAKCATGSASSVTKADGSFSVSVTDGKWPCVARVALADGSALHTVAQAPAAATTATANITPITQLVTASVAGGDPAAYYGGFTNAVATALPSTAVASAVTTVAAVLKAGGIDIAPAGDVVAGPVAVAYTDTLATLSTALTTGGTTLAEITTTVGNTSPNAGAGTGGSTTTSGAASLPAAQLLLPHAANCAALRSGTYRVITPSRTGGLAEQSGTIKVDAVTLAVTFTDNSTGTWTANATAAGACRFTDDGGSADIVVSPAGVFVARYREDDGSFRLTIGFPAQSHTLAEVAGTWNALGLVTNDIGSYTAASATATISTAGAFSGVTWCQNDATWSLTSGNCSSVTTDLSTLKANADGGFDSFDPDATASSGRAFMYQAGNGDVMVVEVDGDGSLLMFTKQRTVTAPPVGRVSTSWSLALNAQLLAPAALSESSNTIASVDSTAGSWVRTQHSASGSAFDYPETLFANNPRAGFNYRAAATSTAVNGTSVNVREFNVLSLRGMGLNPVVIPSTKSFIFSVDRP